MQSERKKDQSPKYLPKTQEGKFTEAPKKPSGANNPSNSSKNRNTSPKIQPEHSKGFYSRSKLVSSKSGKVSSTKTNPFIRDSKPLHEPVQKSSENKTTESSSSTKKFGKDFNNSKENTPKVSGMTDPLTRKATLQKRQAFDSHRFLLSLKNNTSPVKFFPALTKAQMSELRMITNEFFQVTKSIDYSGSGLLNYSNFCKVLHCLRFITNPFTKSEDETNCVLKLWRVLGGFDEQKVASEDLHLFIVALLGMPFKLPNVSPQNKHRRSIWALKIKDIQGLPNEFSLLVSIRNNKYQFKENESGSQVITDQEIEINAEESSNFLHDLSEQIDGGPGLSLIYDSGKGRLVRKISLRELSSTPTALLKSNTYGSARDESAENLSLNTSEGDDAVQISSLLTPPAKGTENSGINRISVTKIAREGEADLNNTVSYKPSAKQFNFFGNDDIFGDSMMCESNLLNISELPFTSQNSLQRRSQRVGNLASQKKKKKDFAESNSFMVHPQGSRKFSP
jgi:hypothetical protein